MTDLKIVRHELPTVPAPQLGGDPIFMWSTLAEIRAGEIFSEVRRFVYWDQRDDRPIEVGFEAFIEGLPDTAGVADVVATHPDVFTDLAAVAWAAAEILREVQ